ncbi:MAG: chloride channel protein [Alphaproteobacteria bacterium CG_4_10_14_0_2_um_filter_63_37]|nr:MAG: hypothetical protein AUJ55_11200 [Proteobacteria bacterium CG1_02_64_396]PJA25901.1 MAG: chloride channel protein [Alphaproteobacteria bacterium CG_4_10_14_0_2_um_filter_63_37]
MTTGKAAPMRQRLSKLLRNEQVALNLLAVFIGAAVGYAAVGFRHLITLFQTLFLGSGDELLVTEDLPWFLVILGPVGGGLAVGMLLHRFSRDAAGNGIPEVIEAVAVKGGVIGWRSAWVRALAASISIGSGGSVGREGPMVHLGSAIASLAGQRLQLSRRWMKTLVACGAAAAVAASFNTPIAGVMFSLEVILGEYGLAAFSPIVVAAVIATVIIRAHFGNFPAFIVPEFGLVSNLEIPAYILLGVGAAVVSTAFIKLLYGFEDLYSRVPVQRQFRPALAGLLVGILGLAFPQILGTGYHATDQALSEALPFLLLCGILVAKILASSFCVASGMVGGVFGPSLVIGAMYGGAFGLVAHSIFPDISSTSGAYALVGMAGVVAATQAAPISAILMIFELTTDYHIVLPMMVSVMLATLLTKAWCGDSIYTLRLRRRGLDIRQGQELSLLKNLEVSEVMRIDFDVVGEGMPIGRLKQILAQSRYETVFVVDGAGKLAGVVSFSDIKRVAFGSELDDLVVAREIASSPVHTVPKESTLFDAFRIIDQQGHDILPVVESYDPDQVIGVITREDLIRAYNKTQIELR